MNVRLLRRPLVIGSAVTAALALSLMAALAVTSAAPVTGLTMTLQSGGSTLTVADNGVYDSDATTGVVVFNGSFDVFTVTLTGISKPVLGTSSTAQLSLTGISSSTTGGTLVAWVTDTGFPGPSIGGTTVFSSVGGTTTGVTTYQSYVDPGDVAFGTAGACTGGPDGPFSGAFDANTTFSCTLSGSFSISASVQAQIGAGGVQSFGSTITLDVPSGPIGCRFTGGGVDTDGNWNHVLEDGEMVRNGAGNLPDGVDRYQFGGQVGARTASQPQPSGEWQHHQQTGPSGSFAFHGGTSSAAEGTRIVDVRCSDPGYCFPARPAPAKQLDFDGIGTFSNVGKGSKAPVFEIPGANVIPEPSGKKDSPFTFHWFEVNIDDLGEPGRLNSGAPDSAVCPGRGFGEKSAGIFNGPSGPVLLPYTPLANCDCPDFYRITIYRGVLSSDVTYLPDGRIDPASLNQTDVIYESFGYIDGGNLQIHPPTGYDSK